MLLHNTPNYAEFCGDQLKNAGDIGQTSLEIQGGHWASTKKCYFVTDGEKRDYLSRNSQCARGATKNGQNCSTDVEVPSAIILISAG